MGLPSGALLRLRGERNEAFEWLEKARSSHDTGTVQTMIHPLLRNLHDDARWPALLRKFGFNE